MKSLSEQLRRAARTATAMLMCASSIAASAQAKLHTIGDSTMQTYDESSTDKRGWAQMLQQFFDTDKIKVNNRGKSGASSKSFYKESAYWPTLNGGSDCIKSGDFVVIQFAHNDEKTSGTDGDELTAYNAANGITETVDYRGTTPFGTYKDYLRKYIEDTKKLGGKPILVAPICRKYFNGNTIKRSGKHDLGDKFNIIENGVLKKDQKIASTDHKMDYVYQMKQVAEEYDDVPFIDMTTATAELYLSYGETFCTTHLFCNDDSTHPAAMGATLIARCFATLLKQQAEGGETNEKKRAILEQLAEAVILTSDVTLSPSSGDFGSTYSGQAITKEFSLAAFNLNPANGEFVVTTDGDFTVSSDKKEFSNEAKIAYTGGTLISQIYVKCESSANGAIVGHLNVTNGTLTKSIDLTAQIITIEGGGAVSVVWPLTKTADPTVNGAITALDETWSGCYAKSYAAINSAAVWPAESGYTAARTTQRNCITGDKWPSGEIDEVSTRYIQFGVEAPAGTEIAINNISMYVAGAGGSGMRCKIYYSTDPTFANNTQITEMKSMAGNTAYLIQAKPVLNIKNGEKLFVRIYPWYSSEATGKTICFSDVTISGIALGKDNTAIEKNSACNDVVETTYYKLNGIRTTEPTKGLNIVCKTLADGSKKVEKMIK